jgi:hypothetical protein
MNVPFMSGFLDELEKAAIEGKPLGRSISAKRRYAGLRAEKAKELRQERSGPGKKSARELLVGLRSAYSGPAVRRHMEEMKKAE